jgi:NitT/TauT family transport system ATP-binding protein
MGESVKSETWQISVENLNLIYPTGDGPVEALRDLSFQVEAGSFLTIVGPSGCGKSTLLRTICGLAKPTSGSVHFHFRGGAAGERKDRFGMVFQRPVLLPWLQVLDNVLLPVRVFGFKVEAYRERAMELLRMVELEGFLKKYPYELSGGMQQRVAIVRALVFDPPVLLMDEPFSALDAITREQLNDQLHQLWLQTGKTILFVTHSVHEAVFLSTSCLVLTERPGRIAASIPIALPRRRRLQEVQDEMTPYILQVRTLLEKKGGE